MMSDEALVERIREAMEAEVSDVVAPADLLERVPAVRPRRRWGGFARSGGFSVALAVAVSVAVAVVAVSSLSHRRPAQGGQAVSGVPAGARGLASHLAVLRRPQAAADRLPRWAARETQSLLGHSRLIGTLTRRIGTVSMGRFGRAVVYMIVQTPYTFPKQRRLTGENPYTSQSQRHIQSLATPEPSPRLGDLASLVFVGRIWHGGSGFADSPTVAYPWPLYSSRGPLQGPFGLGGVRGAQASIVPDGVARVKWVFDVLAHSRRIIVRPRVRSNVAIEGNLSDQVGLVGATWYARDGRVISSLGAPTGPARKTSAFKPALEASVHQTIAPALVRHFAALRSQSDFQTVSSGLAQGQVASLIVPNPFGLNVSKTRFVRLATAPHPAGGPAGIWIIPGHRGVALRAGTHLPVTSVAAALNGSLFTISPAGHGMETITGLAPDGNGSVSVVFGKRAGSRSVAGTRVVDSVYSVTVSSTATTLVVRNAKGRTVRIALRRRHSARG